MKIKDKHELIQKINCNIASIIILMNSLQLVIGWNFNITFNIFWIEYGLIIFLLIINRFKLTSRRNIIVLSIVTLCFLINLIFKNTTTLNEYIRVFLLVGLPLFLIFIIKIDLEKFSKTFLIYNIINLALYLMALVINPEAITNDYMTFGINSIFSLSYICIYSFYNKNIKMFIISLIVLPVIIVNGNRGTIIIIAVAIIMILIFNQKKYISKIVSILIIATIAINITNIGKGILDFVIQNLGISSYSVNNFYRMLESDDTEEIIGGRYSIYKDALEEIDNNLLLGMGIGGFEEKYGRYPHNIILDVYSTFGVIIGTLVLTYVVILGIKLYKISKKNVEARIFLAFLIANFAKLMTSKCFVYDQMMWLYIVVANYIITIYGGKYNENNSIHTNLQ